MISHRRISSALQCSEAPGHAAGSSRSSVVAEEQAPGSGGLDSACDPSPEQLADSADGKSEAAECDGPNRSDVPSRHPGTGVVGDRRGRVERDEPDAAHRALIERLQREIEKIDSLLARGRTPRQ